MKGAYEETDLAGFFQQRSVARWWMGWKILTRKFEVFRIPLSILSGVESRTSSPVRIVRDNHSLESVIGGPLSLAERAQDMPSGITSAAADGIKIAEKIRQKYAPFL